MHRNVYMHVMCECMNVVVWRHALRARRFIGGKVDIFRLANIQIGFAGQRNSNAATMHTQAFTLTRTCNLIDRWPIALLNAEMHVFEPHSVSRTAGRKHESDLEIRI